MQKLLEALWREEIRFDEFARRTESDWTRLAGKLYSQWRRNIPVGVAVEDIRQEMLLHAWMAVQSYRSERGMSLKGYVVCRAWQEGVRFIHIQRCAKRRDDKADSRHPVTFAELLSDAQSDWTESILLASETNTETIVEARERYEQALREAEGVDLYALVALRMTFGSIPDAGELLFEDSELRLHARWGSSKSAVRQIERSLRACCA